MCHRHQLDSKHAREPLPDPLSRNSPQNSPGRFEKFRGHAIAVKLKPLGWVPESPHLYSLNWARKHYEEECMRQ